ncbi:MAG: LysE family transporter [Solidesulfovibrio sp.]|uniref:LysE family translocator n=1 Tax=Solidesulfovibrio sp. TaxID=2910990 RepID=UPI002B20B7DF|nr:LysE family transporter [Solidesulfovibrio sp.]MEA4857190.1 LysE family transporter [Solidesulfovibrio sp.]
MHTPTYAVYLVTLTASMLTPGPAMLQALTLGLRHGCRPVVFVALGNVCATLLQILIALYGLSLLSGRPWVLRAATVAGAGYVAWLGLGLWRASAREIVRDDRAGRSSPLSLAAQGAGVAAVNPKAWAFLGALLPPFAAGGMPRVPDLALVSAPIVLLAFGGMLAYARFGVFLAGALAAPRAARRFFRALAVTLWGCAACFLAG